MNRPCLKFTTDIVVKRLRWVMLGAILFDNINTLVGQPSSYWQHPETVQEGNHLTHWFISRGCMSFCLYELAYMAGTFLLVSIIPRRLALVVILAFIFGHYYGASTWLAHRWHLGTQGTVIYAIILAAIVVLAAFPKLGELNAPKPEEGK